MKQIEEEVLERETGVEPATSSLGSLRSTPELLPLLRAGYLPDAAHIDLRFSVNITGVRRTVKRESSRSASLRNGPIRGNLCQDPLEGAAHPPNPVQVQPAQAAVLAEPRELAFGVVPGPTLYSIDGFLQGQSSGEVLTQLPVPE